MPSMIERQTIICEKQELYRSQKTDLQQWKDSVSYGQEMDGRNCILMYEENV